jgi:Ca2+-binding EF-hand superfamily protein
MTLDKFETNVLQAVMRRCGHNPTDIEVADIINKVHDETGSLGFEV